MKTEEKANAYDELLVKAKQIYNKENDVLIMHTIEDLFPELAESKDEKIKKSLIEHFKFNVQQILNDFSNRDVLAWLEKQGNPQPTDKMQVSEELYEHIRNTCACIDDALSSETLVDIKDYLSMAEHSAQSAFDMIEKQNKQEEPQVYETEDGEVITYSESEGYKVIEPKFHEGDLVVDNCDYVWKIKGILNQFYILEGIEGGESRPTIEWVDKTFHLWTIQDAKDGDMLACNEEILLFKSYSVQGRISLYCWYNGQTNNFHSKGVDDTLLTTRNKIYPATKEQCDTLLKAMTDAGYTFDFEKKELKKIQDEEYNDEDYGIDGLYHAQRILEKTLGKVDGYQSDDGILEHKCAITAVKKLYEHKPTNWSKEDEVKDNWEYIQDFINKLGHFPKDSDELDVLINYVLSKKQKFTLNEKDSIMLNDVINLIEQGGYVKSISEHYINWLKSLKDKLKSLRQRKGE